MEKIVKICYYFSLKQTTVLFDLYCLNLTFKTTIVVSIFPRKIISVSSFLQIVMDFVEEIESATGRPLSSIDIGGGLSSR